MRTKYSVLNVLSGMLSQVLIALIGFVSRKVFIATLGIGMQGVNATLTSVITMLSLSELGIGTAIICNLYKPLADGDEKSVTSLMQLYAKVYRIIAGIVLFLGLLVVPALPMILAAEDVAAIPQGYLTVVYLLFLCDVVISYLFAYKRSILTADQKNYVVTLVATGSNLLTGVTQIVVLLLTKNFVFYLLLKIFFRLAENLILALIANRRYPYICEKEKIPVPKPVRYNIFSNTKALALHYIGNYLINGTDMMIITKFLGTAVSGVYSNYYMILTVLKTVFSQISAGITASFGHLLSEGNKESLYAAFRKVLFVVFALSNFAAITLFCLFQDFLQLWLPGIDRLSMPVVFILCLNFYITSISEPAGGLRASAGLFRPDRYLHLFLAALNLVVSILLVQRIGVFGVFLGTFFCLCIKELTVLPWIVYRNLFEKKLYLYQLTLLGYFAVTLLGGALTWWICSLVTFESLLLTFICHAGICVLLPNLLVAAVFFKTGEFRYLTGLIGGFIRRIIKRGGEETAS